MPAASTTQRGLTQALGAEGEIVESWGPAVSGAIGGALATLLCSAWAKWVPTVCNRKGADTLLRQNRAGIILANVLFFVGLGLAIAVYVWGYFPSNDWRGFGLGAGFAFTAPLVVLPLSALIFGRDPREALVAFAISQKTPMVALYLLLISGAAMFVASLTSLLST
jgi:hypothetical protein